MTDDANELPLFPTNAPAIFSDPGATAKLFGEVLERLADVVELSDVDLGQPTTCDGFTLGDLQRHTLGWLQYFAAALSDPYAASSRPDPDTFELVGTQTANSIVANAQAVICTAIADGVSDEVVTMSSSRMAGDGVLAMALGEYIVHAWDLATATGRPYSVSDDAIQPALDFLRGMVAPEYRGPDSGFFGDEVEVSSDAPLLHKLLGFTGRNPEMLS